MKRILKTTAIILFWLIVWEVLAKALNQKLLLVSPVDTAKRLFELAKTADFWKSLGSSFLHIMLGFILAALAGTLLASISRAFSLFYELISPLLSVIKATPVASFTLLVFLWIKSEYLSIFISFIMVLPVIFFGVYEGIGKADKKLIEMADVFGVSTIKKIGGIYIPATIPFLISAASVSIGFAWKSGIAAEIICITNQTVGGSLYNAKLLLETPDIFAWTVVIIAVSKLTEVLFVKLISIGKAGDK